MIGVFDSGVGGLTVLRALVARLPEERFLYLGDHAFAPYGRRPADEIYALTRRAVDRLFREGCGLVVIACNTASAVALRRLQQAWLPTAWPDRNILGVFVPAIEALSGRKWTAPGPTRYSPRRPARTVAVFATRTTVQSNAFGRELKARAPHLTVLQQACPRLAEAIEEGWAQEDIDRGIARYVGAVMAKAGGTPVDLAVLGCTHYPLVQDLFRKHLPEGVTLLDQPMLCAEALAAYLGRHKRFARRVGAPAGAPAGGDAGGNVGEPAGASRFLTSGDPKAIGPISERFFGASVPFEHLRGDLPAQGGDETAAPEQPAG